MGLAHAWEAVCSLVSVAWAGFVSFVAAAPAHTELMRLSFLATVEFFFSPWNLVVMYSMFFTGLCTANWDETKRVCASVYAVAAEAARAVWAVASDPQRMLQFGVLVVMLRLLPLVADRLRLQT